jgi:nicotinamide-nucleotide amidase
VKTILINIGNELLIGQVVNTNASWMAEQLNRAGFNVDEIAVVGDSREAILGILSRTNESFDMIIVTGGLGPTKDDITKQVICEYFETHLVFREDAFRDIEMLFAGRGFPVTPSNRKQAELPEKCTDIPNTLGTARGMWFEKESPEGHLARFVFLPAVPFEMKAMMEKEIIPRMKGIFRPQAIVHRTILTQGIGESFLSDRLEPWETKLPTFITLAYLPQPGIVRLRLTGKGDSEEEVTRAVDEEVKKMVAIIPEYIFGEDEERLEEIVGQLLKEKGMTLALAESCTGGYISHLITSVPGSSAWYRGGLVAYTNDLKAGMLDVRPDIIEKYGAVSEPVIREMVNGVLEHFHCDAVIATSGIAGPTGGTDTKPVGTTWIAVYVPDKLVTHKFLFGDERERVIRRAALQALNMLRKELVSIR